jgi:hypothetical protein
MMRWCAEAGPARTIGHRDCEAMLEASSRRGDTAIGLHPPRSRHGDDPPCPSGKRSIDSEVETAQTFGPASKSLFPR